MNAAVILADTGNIGLAACAALDTCGVIAYWARAHGGPGGKWWKTPFGVHLMCFMAAFAVVLDQSVIYLLTGPGLLVTRAPGVQPDWFAWVRTVSFSVLIPGVLAWRLWLILRPPKRLRLPLGVVVGVVTVGQCEQLQQQVAFAGRAVPASPLALYLGVHTVDQVLDFSEHAPLRRNLPQCAGRIVAGDVLSFHLRWRAFIEDDDLAVLAGNASVAAVLIPRIDVPVRASARILGRHPRDVLVLVEPRRQERDQVFHSPIVSPAGDPA